MRRPATIAAIITAVFAGVATVIVSCQPVILRIIDHAAAPATEATPADEEFP